MTTLYVDFENGDDTYAGSSFSLLASGTNGRITTATFSAATASFPNDGSLIGQYLSIFNGTAYIVYQITAWVSSTSLTIAIISGGSALANQAVDRQYYIGGRWKSMTLGALALRIAPGDTIRMMGSPAPTSLGNATWTGGFRETENTYTSATNATPIVVTFTAHGYSTGDTVAITNDTGNLGANGVWYITVTGANTFSLDGSVGTGTSGGAARRATRANRRIVTLASAVTQNIACTGVETTAAWTGATADVTSTLDTTNVKEHRGSTSIVVGANFTTGKAAYYTLPTELNLSAYNQVSFWFRQQTGTLSGTAYTLRLCSDTLGNTTVNTIAIPIHHLLLNWRPITVDLGGALGASIKSIAFYVESDLGTTTLQLDNIIATPAPSSATSLGLDSLIGKNISTDTWYAIESINGTRVMLSHNFNTGPNLGTRKTYLGASGTVTTYKRETITMSAQQTLLDSGTSGNLISVEGGWDRTAMTTQNLETWLDFERQAVAIGFLSSTKSFVSLNNLHVMNAVIGIEIDGTCSDTTINNVSANYCSGRGIYHICAGLNHTISTIVSASYGSSNSAGIDLQTDGLAIDTIGLIHGHGSGGTSSQGVLIQGRYTSINTIESIRGGEYYGMYIGAPGVRIKDIQDLSLNSQIGLYLVGATSASGKSDITINNLVASDTRLLSGIGHSIYADFGNKLTINGGSSTGSAVAGIRVDQSDLILKNFAIDDATEFTTVAANTLSGYYFYSQNHDNTANNHKIFTDGGLISADTAIRNTASGISWKFQPTITGATGRNSFYPLTLSLAKVACAANSLVTIKAWMRRDNTGITMRLVCKGKQIAGVTNDVVSSVSAAADTWAEQTITFTPTEIGVVEITAEAYGGTTFSGWVDDLTISQA